MKCFPRRGDAHRDTNRLFTVESEKDQLRGMPPQPGDQSRPNLGIEWFRTIHRVQRVGVDHCKHCCAIFG